MSHGTFGVAGSGAGQDLTHEITVHDGDKIVHMQVMRGITAEYVEKTMREGRERAAHRPPLAVAIDDGDLAAVRRLLAAKPLGDPEADPYGRPIGWAARAAVQWSRESAKARNDTPRQAQLARDGIAMIDALVAAGSDLSQMSSWQTVLTAIPLRMPNGQPIPGAMGLFERLLRKGASVDLPSDPGVPTPLELAIRDDDARRISMILELGRPSKATLGRAFEAALSKRRWDVALRMLDAGLDPNMQMRYPAMTPLAFAMGNGGYVVRPLLEGLLARPVDASHGPWLAIAMHDHELMEKLLARGANPNAARTPEGMTPLHLAVIVPRDPEGDRFSTIAGQPLPPSTPETRRRSVELLLAHGADPNARNRYGRTPLMMTSAQDAGAIDLLVAAGGTINLAAPGEAGPGPVSWALLHRNETLATALVKRRPEVARADCGALFYAAASGATTTLEALLALGIPPDSRNSRGESALMAAARGGHVEAMRLLLDRGGAVVDEQTSPPRKGLEALELSGKSALMIAASADQPEAVRFLLARGAAVNAEDAMGATALDHARRSGQPHRDEIASALVEHGGVARAEEARSAAFVVTSYELCSRNVAGYRERHAASYERWRERHAAGVRSLERNRWYSSVLHELLGGTSPAIDAQSLQRCDAVARLIEKP